MAGPMGGCGWRVRRRPPLWLKETSMADPLGVLLASPAVGTTVVKGDIDGSPLGGHCPSPAAATTIVKGDINSGPHGGYYR
jgi:hypothetical protein